MLYMYILELIAKKLKEKNKKDYKYISPVIQEDYEKCNHTFLPVDSTGEILACTKCGHIVKKNIFEYKTKNPFG